MRAILRHDEELYGTKLYIAQEIDGYRYMARPVELVFDKMESSLLPEPTISFYLPGIGTDFLKSLAGELARMGFRADELKAKDSEMTAVKYHLEDMRNLVFRHMRP